MDIILHLVLPAIVMLGALVFVHESGHFLVGRACGIAVEVYSLGFGPALLSIKRGMTEYRIGSLPLGGYVKFYGMSHLEKPPTEGLNGIAFNQASLLRRYATVAAGPLANVLLAMVVFTVLGLSGIPHPQPVVGEVQPGSVAERVGLQFGDKIVAIDNQDIKTWGEMQGIVSRSVNKALTLKVQRGASTLAVNVTPESADGMDMLGRPQKVGRLGVAAGAVPAILSVIDAGSPAAKAGLETGMRVSKLVLANGETVAIEYYRDFEQKFVAALQRGDSSLGIQVAPTHKDGLAQSELSKTVVLDLAALTRNKIQGLNDLGVGSAQLVIADARQSLELKKNDIITTWAGIPVTSIYQLMERQENNKATQVDLGIVRGFQAQTLSVKLKSIERQLPSGKDEVFVLDAGLLGMPVQLEPFIEKYDNVFSATYFGLKQTAIRSWFLMTGVFSLFTGQVPLKALGGPILIAKVAGDAAEAGWQHFVETMAMISINLAILNLLPLPALDGGQIIVFTVEAVRRRRMSDQALENMQRIGFVVIMSLAVIATYNDISRFWGAMIRSLAGAG